MECVVCKGKGSYRVSLGIDDVDKEWCESCNGTGQTKAIESEEE